MNSHAHKIWIPSLGFLIFLGGFFLFFHNLSNPKALLWDETYHVTAARSFLYSQPGQYRHPNHLPLGREIIALSILTFGDNPWGHRMPSALAAAGIGGILFWGLFRNTRRWGLAVLGGGLWLSSSLGYVHARLGMLDMFLTFFFTLSFLCFWVFFQEAPLKIRTGYFLSSLVFASLATLVKPLGAVLFPLYGIGLWLRRTDWPLKRSLPVWALGSLAMLGVGILVSYGIIGISPGALPEQFAHLLKIQRYLHADYSGLSRWWEWFLFQGDVWYFTNPIQANQALLATQNQVLWILGTLALLALNFYPRVTQRPFYLLMGLNLVFQILFWEILKKQSILYYALPIIPLFCLAIPLVGFEMSQLRVRKRYLWILGLLVLTLAIVSFIRDLPWLQYGPRS
jgi:dolichyl-phosphate-mannose-protein mannosyltransferase